METPAGLESAVRAALAHDSKVLVEEAIPGFEVGQGERAHPGGVQNQEAAGAPVRGEDRRAGVPGVLIPGVRRQSLQRAGARLIFVRLWTNLIQNCPKAF